MILFQAFLFLLGLVYGIAVRFLYKAVTKLEKIINLRAITIILDLIIALAIVVGFMSICYFFCDGLFLPFVFISSIIGFIITARLL